MAEEETGFPPALWSEDFSGPVGTDMGDLGYQALGLRGYARVSADHSLEIQSYTSFNVLGGPGGPTGSSVNITTASSGSSIYWQGFQTTGATKSFVSTVKSNLIMPDNTAGAYEFTFATGANIVSGLCNPITTSMLYNQPYNFSVWARTKPGAGTANIKFQISRYTGLGGTPVFTDDIVVTEELTRINGTITLPGTGSAGGSWLFGFRNGTGSEGKTVVLWGFQISPTQEVLPYRRPASWSGEFVKDTGVINHSVECDILASSTAAEHIILRGKFGEVSVGLGGAMIRYDNGLVYCDHYSRIDGYGIASPIPCTETVPFRLRAECIGEKVYFYSGPAGEPWPTKVLGNAAGYTLRSSWNQKSTYAGFGIGRTQATPLVVSDNYAAREAKKFVTVTKARSETRSDVILPLNYAWIDNFDAPAGTALVDRGFRFETTELNGDPRKAIIGADQKLDIQLSSQSAAVWTKPVGSRDHFIEATIYSKPRATLHAPLIIRVAGPEYWIGLWIDDSKGYDRVVFGYRYASSVGEFWSTRVTTTEGSAWSFPIKVKIEAKAHYAYIYYLSQELGFWPVEKDGWYIDENATPLLYESGNGYRTGIARIGDSSSTGISSLYRSGSSLIASTTLPTMRRGRSETREDKAVLNGETITEGIKTYSDTFADYAPVVAISIVDGIPGRSETTSDEGGAYPEARSLTRSDKACVSTDIIVVNKATSGTTADAWYQPSEVESGSKGTSETFSDPIDIEIHTIIFEAGLESYPEGYERPPRISGARSVSRIVGKAPINNHSIVDTDLDSGEDGGLRKARSTTFSDKPVITRFIWPKESRSETYTSTPYAAVRFSITPNSARSPTRADGPGGSSEGGYRPWLFT